LEGWFSVFGFMYCFYVGGGVGVYGWFLIGAHTKRTDGFWTRTPTFRGLSIAAASNPSPNHHTLYIQNYPVYKKLILRIVPLCKGLRLLNVVFLFDSQLRSCKNLHAVLSASAISLHIIQSVHKIPSVFYKCVTLYQKQIQTFSLFMFLQRAF